MKFRPTKLTLVDLQLDAPILIYLHIIPLLKSSTCFEHYPAHLKEVYVVNVYLQPLISSLSAGDYPLHRLRKNSIDTQFNHIRRIYLKFYRY